MYAYYTAQVAYMYMYMHVIKAWYALYVHVGGSHSSVQLRTHCMLKVCKLFPFWAKAHSF